MPDFQSHLGTHRLRPLWWLSFGFSPTAPYSYPAPVDLLVSGTERLPAARRTHSRHPGKEDRPRDRRITLREFVGRFGGGRSQDSIQLRAALERATEHVGNKLRL